MGAPSFRKSSSTPPCHLFLWDAPSAGRFHLCKRLLRGKIYEGLGGKKFVRIKPNSVLEKLYPPSKHSPDRCLICGHTFDNHLKSWWFPNLYSAFDTHLDEIYEKYTLDINNHDNNSNMQTRLKNNSLTTRRYSSHRLGVGKPSSSRIPLYPPNERMEMGMKPIQDLSQKDVFRKREFHKRYVEDISDVKEGGKNAKNSMVQYNVHGRNSRNQQISGTATKFETRRIFDVKYRVPFINVMEKDYTLGSAVLLAVTRTLVLERLDAILWLQTVDNRWHEWKRNQ